jgi:hypothetical protein
VTRVPRSPDPTDRLLAFAAELVAEVDDVDLDTIDGECYWRWCRRDLSDTLERLTASLRLVGAPSSATTLTPARQVTPSKAGSN